MELFYYINIVLHVLRWRTSNALPSNACRMQNLKKKNCNQALVYLINIKYRLRFPSFWMSYCRVETMLKLHNGWQLKIDKFMGLSLFMV